MSAIQQLITEHMDIWTAADTGKRSGRGRASSNAGSVYGVKKLRELILELAVRGKLVSQDANDEPASELLKRIKVEKAKLVAEGKIKKEKPLIPITDDEKPFELPKGWGWSKLGQIGLIGSSSRIHQKDWTDSGVPFYRAREIVKLAENGFVDNELFISESLFESLKQNSIIPEPKDIMITGVGTIGVPYVVMPTDRFYFKDASVLIFKNFSNLYTGYLNHFFLSTIWKKKIHAESMGTTVHTLTIERAKEVLIPLPPLAEQQRIVAKVDELMALCDQLEAQHSNAVEAHEKLVSHLLGTLTQSQNADDFSVNWQRIAAHFDTLFTTEASIDNLKQTLLQLAVMGKLVPQDANDEPASELLKRIQAEKAKLIGEGKLKKEKAFALISEEEKPFQLPKDWEWVRIEFLNPDFQNGVSSRGDVDGEPIVVLRLADINERRISLDDPRELTISSGMIEKYRLNAGDILIVRVNGSADLVGGFVLSESVINAIYCDHFIRMRISQNVLNPRFLNLVGASSLIRDRIKDLFITTAGQKTVNQTHISSLVIPLLPLAEQHRIVAKVDELMGLCDKLKNRIQQANQQQQAIANALVAQAVA